MPAYNVEAYIGEAIESVQTQTMADWEMVVVNDGSTDGTADIVAGTADGRVRLINQANAGHATARNTGLEACGADLIMFLDADDKLLPTALQRLTDRLEEDAAVCVAYGNAALIDVQGRRISAPNFGPVSRPSGDVLEVLLRRNHLVTTGVACVRNRCLQRSGGFRSSLKKSADWEFWCRLAAEGAFSWIGHEPVIEYRVRPDSVVRTEGLTFADYLPSLDAVYANETIQARFPERVLRKSKRKRVSFIHSLIAREQLRKRNWTQARWSLLQSVARDPRRPREAILLGFALLRWLPTFVRTRAGL